jgi:hypothetical protein
MAMLGKEINGDDDGKAHAKSDQDIEYIVEGARRLTGFQKVRSKWLPRAESRTLLSRSEIPLAT